MAGTCSTLVTNPIWVIKTRLMSQSNSRSSSQGKAPWHYRNTLDCAMKMYRNEGLRSFYSGLTPALIGLSHVAVQFPLYEIFKTKFTGIRPGVEHSEEDRSRHFFGLSFSVFLSKVIASTATYPHEVVRTRLQTQQRWYPEHSPENLAYRGTSSQGYGHGQSRLPGGASSDGMINRHSPETPAYQSSGSQGYRHGPSRPPGGASSDGMINRPLYRGTVQTCKAILVEEGWRGFYAGLGTNLIRAVPSAMTTILTFEYLKSACLEQQKSSRAKLERSI